MRMSLKREMNLHILAEKLVWTYIDPQATDSPGHQAVMAMRKLNTPSLKSGAS